MVRTKLPEMISGERPGRHEAAMPTCGKEPLMAQSGGGVFLENTGRPVWLEKCGRHKDQLLRGGRPLSH